MEMNIRIYNRFFHYCETLGSNPLKEYQQNNHESWLGQNLSDSESQVSNVKQDKYPTNALKKFRKHETVNLIRLKHRVKANTKHTEHNEQTEEAIRKAEKDFALDLPLPVDATARDVKVLNAITALKKVNWKISPIPTALTEAI